MHAYDPFPRAPFHHPIPGMRPSYDGPAPTQVAEVSYTPIYDALYAEYRRSFRALPGDRTGEEGLGIEAIRNIWGRTTSVSGPWDTQFRHPQTPPPAHLHPHYPTRHTPAALPPVPRDGWPHGR